LPTSLTDGGYVHTEGSIYQEAIMLADLCTVRPWSTRAAAVYWGDN